MIILLFGHDGDERRVQRDRCAGLSRPGLVTTPSTGAVITCSIFMASTTTRR